jgi:hypothetical protein
MSWYSTDEEFDKALGNLKPQPPVFPDVEYHQPQTIVPMAPSAARKRDREFGSKESNSYFPGGFFQLPNRLFSSGKAADLSPSEGWLYAALCSRNNENSYRTSFRVADRVLADETGMGIATIRAARKTLKDVGLIDFEVRPGKMCSYTVLKIALERVPAKERKTRKKHNPRGKSFAKTEEDGFAGLPQILRESPVKFAKPHTFSKEGSFFSVGIPSVFVSADLNSELREEPLGTKRRDRGPGR